MGVHNGEPKCGRPPMGRGLPMWTPNGEPNGGRNWSPTTHEVDGQKARGVPMGCRSLDGHLTARWRWTWSRKWKPLTARVGRTGPAMVDGDGRNRGAIVDGDGGLTWSQVDADRGRPAGRRWWPNLVGQVVGSGRRTWGQVDAEWPPCFGRPPNREVGNHGAAMLAAHCWA